MTATAKREAFLWALLCCSIVLCLTAGAASGRQLQKRGQKKIKEKVDEKCLKKPLETEKFKYIALPTTVSVDLKRFADGELYRRCTLHGASYNRIIKWSPDDGVPGEETLKAEKEQYEITGLKPYTKVTITVFVRYTDENGDTYNGNEVTNVVMTAVDKPTAPRNFKIQSFENGERGKLDATAVWEEPDVRNGPLNGYQIRICKVWSCEDKPHPSCSHRRGVKIPLYTATGFTKAEYYWVWVAGYHEAKEKVIGENAHLCVRIPPKAVGPVRDFKVTCPSETNKITATWKLPQDNNAVPESYRVELVRDPGGQKEVYYDVDIQKACKNEDCTFSVEELTAGNDYELILSPNYTNIGINDKGKCRVSGSAIAEEKIGEEKPDTKPVGKETPSITEDKIGEEKPDTRPVGKETPSHSGGKVGGSFLLIFAVMVLKTFVVHN